MVRVDSALLIKILTSLVASELSAEDPYVCPEVHITEDRIRRLKIIALRIIKVASEK